MNRRRQEELTIIRNLPHARCFTEEQSSAVSSNCFMCVHSHSVMSGSAASWAVGPQAPMSMEFSRQEHKSGLPFITLEHLPNPGIEPVSLCISSVGRQILYHGATWEDACF